MDYLVVGLAAAVFILIVIRRSKAFFDLAESSVHLLDVFLAPGTDEEKLPTIEKRTGKLTGSLLRVILILAVAAAVAFALVFLYDQFIITDRPFAPSSTWNLVAVSVGATLPFFLPIGAKTKSAYSPLAQLLHHLALDNPNLGLRLQRRDVHSAQKQGIEHKSEFLIITGLARAGTTSLLNKLSPQGPFASLNYANMPFVLAPRTWANFYKPKDLGLKERSHGDGVMVGLDSNEALEEVFWKAITENQYVGENCLQQHDLSEDQCRSYLDYQRVIRQNNDEVYVAKNNNFLLRYEGIRRHNSDFTAVILFREPLHHAGSLMEKHMQYVEMQNDDPFVLDYMNWLAHHEFGKGHKGFCFENTQEWIQKAELWPQDNINHWLAIWLAVYGYASTIDDTNTIFVSYEEFCSEPTAVVNRIVVRFASGREAQNLTPHQNKRAAEFDADPELLAEAERIYALLLRKANNE